jgi:inner membrane protein
VDNLTHSLCGLALARTKLGRAHRLAPLSLLIGANLPDIDCVSELFGGRAAYLEYHRGITHSLVGAAGLALLLAVVMRIVERRRAPSAAPPFTAFLLPAAIGLLSHPLLDLLNTYGVRPWLPFSEARWYGDLVFILDPWLWILFGAVALLAGPRTRAGHVLWAVVALATAALVWTSGRVGVEVKAVWSGLAIALALLRSTRFGAARPAPVVAAGATLVALYLGGLELGARRALAGALTRRADLAIDVAGDREPAHFVMRSPALADPFHWSLCFQSGESIRWRGVDLEGELSARGASGSGNLESDLSDPDVLRAAARPEAAPWRSFARVPFAWKEVRPDGSIRVFLSDARYLRARSAAWCVVEVELPGPAAGSAPPR